MWLRRGGFGLSYFTHAFGFYGTTLGGMYPVAGGTARFPHIAFGGAAGASFGWFSWLQAVTVARSAKP